MLDRLQSEYGDKGFKVVAINFDPNYSLDEWTTFWKRIGAGDDVLWAQDTNGSTARDFRLVALGTEIIVDRRGGMVFRSDGPSGYKRLRSEIEKAL